MNLLKLFVFLIAIHALYNLINFFRYGYIERLFLGNYTNDTNLNAKAKSHKNAIINYIKYSGVQDRYIPISQPVGYGQIVAGNVSIFNNILNPRVDIATNARDLLLEAKGNYWSRFINSINPFYWLRIVLYIPKYLLSYLGIKPDSALIKFFQLVYWLIGIICAFAIAVFPEEIKSFIISFINVS